MKILHYMKVMEECNGNITPYFLDCCSGWLVVRGEGIMSNAVLQIQRLVGSLSQI